MTLEKLYGVFEVKELFEHDLYDNTFEAVEVEDLIRIYTTIELATEFQEELIHRSGHRKIIVRPIIIRNR